MFDADSHETFRAIELLDNPVCFGNTASMLFQAESSTGLRSTDDVNDLEVTGTDELLGDALGARI